jgi:hypothetical protein
MIAGLAACVLAAERASRWVTSNGAGRAATLDVGGDDPFRLVVPPLVGSDGHDIDGPTLEALAGLYLMSQLEQAGVLAAAELLITHRSSLDLTSIEAAQVLEDAAVQAREWITAEEREHLFARVFGTAAAGTSTQDLANREFPQLLAELCSAIEDYDSSTAVFRPPPSHLRSGVGRAVQRLRSNLALRQYGSTLVASRRIAGQVNESVQVLSQPGIIQLARGRTMWDVVRATWDPDEQPDLEGLVTSGQAGQVVIGWTGAPDAETAPPPATVRDAAVQWLMSSGLAAQEVA